MLGDLVIEDQRISSNLRERDEEIFRLRNLLAQRAVGEIKTFDNEALLKLKDENSSLRNLLRSLEGRLGPEEVDNILLPFQ